MRVVDFKDVPELNSKYPLFFQPRFAEYEKTKGWTVNIFTDGQSYMPVKTRKSKFIIQGQYLYPPVNNGNRLSKEDERVFMETFTVFCRQQGICDYLMPPLHYSVFNAIPAGSYYTDLGIIVVDLQKSEEEIFKAFSGNYRNEIRKALAEGVEVAFDNSRFEIFYSLYKNTHQRQGIYFDTEAELKDLVSSIAPDGCKIAVAKKGEEIYGAALVLFGPGEAYYFQSGAMENCPLPGANKLLQLEIMKLLKGRGITRYVMGGYRPGDVSGTKYDGIQKFKMRFGATIEMGFHFYSEITWKYSLYKNLLKWYLALRNIKQNTAGLNYRYT